MITSVGNVAGAKPRDVKIRRGGHPCRLITHAGETLDMADWSRRLGGTPKLVLHRLRRGWSEQDAVSYDANGVRVES
jgi:hypothetical protein